MMLSAPPRLDALRGLEPILRSDSREISLLIADESLSLTLPAAQPANA